MRGSSIRGRSNVSPPNPMTCEEFESFLHSYVDGEFVDAEREEAQSHLANCPACRQAVECQVAFKRRLRQAALSAPISSPLLRSAIVNQLKAEPNHRSLLNRPRVMVPLFFAVAACAVVIFVRINSGRQQANALIAASIAHHLHALPLDVQDQQLSRVRSWMQGRLDFAPSSIPELHNINLLGARVSYLNGRPAAYIVYDSPPQRRVSLFIVDAPDLDLSGGRQVNNHSVLIYNQRGYNVALWKEAEIAYSMVSDLDEKDLLELVATTRHQ